MSEIKAVFHKEWRKRIKKILMNVKLNHNVPFPLKNQHL